MGSQTTIDLEQAARAYIDEAVAISRRHGMTQQLSKEDYDRAVQAAVKALGSLGSAKTD